MQISTTVNIICALVIFGYCCFVLGGRQAVQLMMQRQFHTPGMLTQDVLILDASIDSLREEIAYINMHHMGGTIEEIRHSQLLVSKKLLEIEERKKMRMYKNGLIKEMERYGVYQNIDEDSDD